MTDRLFIAARAPRPGFTKTRLGRAIGHSAAASIYRAFLSDLAARFATVEFDIGWYVTPPDAWPEILPCLHGALHSAMVVPQPEGDWTTRQRLLFADMPLRGEDRTILIASDSPHLPVEFVTHAFEALADHDLVFGPVHDGGYYLIGMRTPRAAAVLDGAVMSNGDVLAYLIDRATSLGTSVALVEPTFDIDEFEDLSRISALVIRRDDLMATRRALGSLNLPSVGCVPRALVSTGIEAES